MTLVMASGCGTILHLLVAVYVTVLIRRDRRPVKRCRYDNSKVDHFLHFSPLDASRVRYATLRWQLCCTVGGFTACNVCVLSCFERIVFFYRMYFVWMYFMLYVLAARIFSRPNGMTIPAGLYYIRRDEFSYCVSK